MDKSGALDATEVVAAAVALLPAAVGMAIVMLLP